MSSIYASYMYSPKDAPEYVIAMSVNCAMAAMAILAVSENIFFVLVLGLVFGSVGHDFRMFISKCKPQVHICMMQPSVLRYGG